LSANVQRSCTRGQLTARASALLFVTMISVGCSEQPTKPAVRAAWASVFEAAPVSSTATTSVRWNEIARRLVAAHKTNGPMASQVSGGNSGYLPCVGLAIQ
jgi:hypothetical protein